MVLSTTFLLYIVFNYSYTEILVFNCELLERAKTTEQLAKIRLEIFGKKLEPKGMKESQLEKYYMSLSNVTYYRLRKFREQLTLAQETDIPSLKNELQQRINKGNK